MREGRFYVVMIAICLIALFCFIIGCASREKLEGKDTFKGYAASVSDDTSTTQGEFVPYDTPPHPISLAEPVYPLEARRSGVEGEVFVKLLIDTTGKVIDARIVKSGGELLDRASLEAAYKTTFKPALREGKPVRVWIGYPFKYSLDKK